jgi:penicillin-binding protein 1A
MPNQPQTQAAPHRSETTGRTWKFRLTRLAFWGAGLLLAVLASVVLAVAVALAAAYPNLPDISDLADYRPKLPLRIYTSEGSLMGEFGEERRSLTPIADFPQVMKDAVLSIEDARFYQHGGVDYLGVIRAGLANMGRLKSQGASTITMQVARNVYLSSEKTYTRKIYEILLTFKLEHLLTKDQILEIYMNQIFLGNRAYGFAAASEAYFGKPIKNITIAEAAMLAGLPKAPSAFNPINNPKRARSRQLYIIERMEENGFITAAQAEAAKKEELKVKSGSDNAKVHAEYVAETVRQLIYAQYGDETYTRGLNVYTTLKAAEQDAAYRALRKGIMDYERRQIYRGPEQFVDLPTNPKELEEAIDDALTEHPDNDDVLSAVVTEANPKKIVAIRQNGESIEITGEGLKPAQSGLSDKAAPKIRIRPGAVIRVVRTPKNTWEITQLPEVEGAFVAVDPRDGAIRALVGGFDFAKNKFNHVTQAWRQPGSSFKPFIYSAALEKGFTPATIVNDAPLVFRRWRHRRAALGAQELRRQVRRPDAAAYRVGQVKEHGVHPGPAGGGRAKCPGVDHTVWIRRREAPALPDHGLGRGFCHAHADGDGLFAVFANGGHRINPWLIARISDQKGKILVESKPPAMNDARAIDARNAFIMSRLLQEVARSGTAAKAQATLKRQTCMARPARPTTRSTPGSPATSPRWPPWSGWATTPRVRWATGKRVAG